MTRSDIRQLALVFFLAVLATPGTALGATRTACFYLVLKDDVRTDCPLINVPGVAYPCKADTFNTDYDYMRGYEFLVYDKDDGLGLVDDYIGTWHTNSGGLNCVTFEWENASYCGGEANPDVYIKINNRATKVAGDGTTVVDAVDQNGTDYPDISWRGGDDDDTRVALNCTVGQSCRIYPQGALTPFTSTATNHAKVLLGVDSARRALELYHDIMDNGVIDIEYPTTRGFPCDNACQVTRHLVAADSAITNGIAMAHEIGHVVQAQMFEQDDLRDDCSYGLPSWALNSIEWQSCATTEGWASYVGVRSWWDSEDPNSWPTWDGFSIEASNPYYSTSCLMNSYLALQVARAFWDLDDENDELGFAPATGYDDVRNMDTVTLASAWDVFPNGTDNRQDKESDANGVNARDFNANYDVNNETFLNHNCIDGQADD